MVFKDELERALERVKSGDTGAFERIVDLTLVPMKVYISFYINDKSVAEDVLQEAYVRIYRELDRYEPGTNFVAWAKTVARFEALAEMRRQERKRTARQNYVAAVAERLGEEALSAEELFTVESRVEFLRKCLEELPEKLKSLVTSRYFDGKSVTDIAKDAAEKMSTVGMRLHRARVALADCIERGL